MKRILMSFALICCICSMCYARTVFEVSPSVNNFQSLPCTPSDFDIKPYVNMMVEATRARDASNNSQVAVDQYKAAIANIEEQIKEARQNQYRTAVCIVSRDFHVRASDSGYAAHIYSRGSFEVSSPDSSWELEMPLDITITSKKEGGRGYVQISDPRRDGNRARIDILVKGPGFGHSDNYVIGNVRGQFKYTQGFIDNKIDQEFPFLWQRVIAAVADQLR